MVTWRLVIASLNSEQLQASSRDIFSSVKLELQLSPVN